MALFQLDPESIVARVEASGVPVRVPTIAESIRRGVIGFAVVSVAGFAPWPIIDRWFPALGEVGLYVACTATFIACSGICLHRLIIGPGSLPRFYKLFSLAFLDYAIAWVVCWMWLRNDAGLIAGLFTGTLAMGGILAFAFDAQRHMVPIVGLLFVLNSAGYFTGAWLEGQLMFDHRLAAMLLWGVCFGMGFGMGLGVAFHLCQQRARAALAGAA